MNALIAWTFLMGLISGLVIGVLIAHYCQRRYENEKKKWENLK